MRIRPLPQPSSNAGPSPSFGLVTVSDVLPPGLTATSIAGTNWACTQPAGPCTRSDPLAALSSREREVLALMAEGRSNAGIARRLWVTEGTVEKHVRSILAKLELHSRVQIATWVAHNDLSDRFSDALAPDATP